MEYKALCFSSFLFFFLLLAASSLPAGLAGGDGGGGGAGGVDNDALDKDADFIDELPNQPEGVEFRQYSGYVVAEPVVNRRYFYYFVEADDIRPLSKPLIIYLGGQRSDINMGSPLLSCFQQVGPYSVEDDGQTLTFNPYSWNKFANILFVEGPAWVGFSVSDDASNDLYHIQEYWLVSQMYNFIVGWMKRFPEYKNSDVYIAGHSYIGFLGPSIATYILYKNSLPANPSINIKGILIGNPRIDEDLEFITRFESTFRMNIISEEINREHVRLCNVSNLDFMTCWPALAEAQYHLLELYPNNVYQQFCPNIDMNVVGLDIFKYMVYDCFEQYVAGYLNIPFVQRVLHVEDSPAMWQPYPMSTFKVDRNITSAMSHLKAAMTKGVRVLIYSGVQDEETVIPNLTVIKCMNLTISSQWRPWFDNDVQVAGFVESYVGGLTHATVRGAGLIVMADQPKRGFIIAKSFVTNSPLPSSKIA